MAANGYIQLHRKIFDWEWWDDQNTFRLFMTILLLANWKDKKWHGKKIKRGSFWTSIASLSEASGLTMQQTRSSLNKLISTGEVTSKATNHGRLVTVVNYGVYQSDEENVTSKPTSKPTDKKQASNKQTNKRVTTTEESKENNKDNNITTTGRGPTMIDLNEVLTIEEMAALSKRYKNIDSLLNEVESDINSKGKTVKYPVRYIHGYARNKEWPRKDQS